jgi:hypothetical protein
MARQARANDDDALSSTAARASPPIPGFHAFTLETVVSVLPKPVTSLCLWWPPNVTTTGTSAAAGDAAAGEPGVLVGLQDGTLLFFQRLLGTVGHGISGSTMSSSTSSSASSGLAHSKAGDAPWQVLASDLRCAALPWHAIHVTQRNSTALLECHCSRELLPPRGVNTCISSDLHPRASPYSLLAMPAHIPGHSTIPQVVKTHRDVERKAALQMQVIALPAAAVPVAAPTTADNSSAGASSNSSTGTSGPIRLSPKPSLVGESSGRGGAGGSSSGAVSPTVLVPTPRQLLLVLTDDGINVRSMPDARLRYQVSALARQRELL